MSRVRARLETGLMFAPYPAARRMRAASPFPSHARTRESRLCQIARTFNGQRLGPRVRGDERMGTLLSFGSFLHRLFRGDERVCPSAISSQAHSRGMLLLCRRRRPKDLEPRGALDLLLATAICLRVHPQLPGLVVV